MKLKSGRVCGLAFDICRLNQNKVSSCCPGYYCGRRLGHFKSKICIPIKNIANASSSNALGNNPFDMIGGTLGEPSESDLNQIADANMTGEMTEEQEEEHYLELLIKLAQKFSIVLIGFNYENDIKKDTKKNIAEYQKDCMNLYSYFTNYIQTNYPLNGSKIRGIKKDYTDAKTELSAYIDDAKIQKYKTIFKIETT